MTDMFLPGVPEMRLRSILEKAGGNEIASGKFASPESSAALAANGFGWFLERPAVLPPFPGLQELDWPALRVDVERQMRFPWRGGRHPWLDAAMETETHHDRRGIEAIRAIPCQQAGETVGCRRAPRRFRHLDGAQLVKHAFGIATEAARVGKAPVLLYVFAEPPRVPPRRFSAHRAEIAAFAAEVAGARVRFHACSWREWIGTWPDDLAGQAAAIEEAFAP